MLNRVRPALGSLSAETPDSITLKLQFILLQSTEPISDSTGAYLHPSRFVSIPKSGKLEKSVKSWVFYMTDHTHKGSPCLLDSVFHTYKQTLLLFWGLGSSSFLDASCQCLKVSSSNPEKKTVMTRGTENKVKLLKLWVAISLRG